VKEKKTYLATFSNGTSETFDHYGIQWAATKASHLATDIGCRVIKLEEIEK
jgi:hypothetical protein